MVILTHKCININISEREIDFLVFKRVIELAWRCYLGIQSLLIHWGKGVITILGYKLPPTPPPKKKNK